MKYFNTTFGLSMAPDGKLSVNTIDTAAAAAFLRQEGVINAANPMHANSLQAITQIAGVDLHLPMDAKAPRVYLESGDEVLVAEISGIPRETREFSEEEIAAAKFRFRVVKIL